MPKKSSASSSDLETLRRSFIESELRRMKLASISVTLIGLVTLVFLALLASAGYPRIEWQLIALLGFVAFCLALPLFRKFDFSKGGGGFETRDPLDLIEKMQAEGVEARGESFEQLRCQIGALSDQLTEVSNQLAALSRAGLGSSGALAAGDTGAWPDESEPTLRMTRESLPPIEVDDDPQKGRFGGDEAASGRILKARVEPSAMGEKWMKVILTVAATNGKPLKGKHVYMFVHDTFQPDEYKVKVDSAGMTASLELLAWGAFTAGAVVDNGTTMLELDLATSPNVDAPKDWRER